MKTERLGQRSGQSKNLYSHTNTWFRTQLVL